MRNKRLHIAVICIALLCLANFAMKRQGDSTLCMRNTVTNVCAITNKNTSKYADVPSTLRIVYKLSNPTKQQSRTKELPLSGVGKGSEIALPQKNEYNCEDTKPVKSSPKASGRLYYIIALRRIII